MHFLQKILRFSTKATFAVTCVTSMQIIVSD